ncbi:MAG: YopX family protein [Clostridium sp.]|nr:YopX family protein [Clostridium sp.]
MNREIKFRAWHKDLKKMFKIGQITLEKGTWNFEPNDRDFIGMSIPSQPSFVLMQYTGLHDKNGKEIYEGDILKVYYKGMSEVGYVEYDNDYCEYKIIINTDKDYFSLWKSIDLEKIGNKYDNPELLRGE